MFIITRRMTYYRRAGQEETREAKAEMGVLDVRKAGEEEDWTKKTRDRGGLKTITSGAEKVAGSTSPLTKGK